VKLLRSLLVVVFVSAMAVATTAQWRTGDQQSRLGELTHAKSVEVILADRRTKCLGAIGSEPFCNCLNAGLPLTVDFQQYIAITTRSSGNEDLSPDDKRIADVVVATRDYCVEKVFPRP
jgi:hypothetical protein